MDVRTSPSVTTRSEGVQEFGSLDMSRGMTLRPQEVKSGSPRVFYMPLSDRRVKVFFERNIEEVLEWALKEAKFDVIIIGSTGTAQLHSIAAEEYYLHNKKPLNPQTIADRAAKLERQTTGKIISCIANVIDKDSNVEIIRWKSSEEKTKTPAYASPSRLVSEINELLKEAGAPLVEEKNGAPVVASPLFRFGDEVADLAGKIKGAVGVKQRHKYPPELPNEQRPFVLRQEIKEALDKKKLDGKTRIIILPLEVITGKMTISIPDGASIWGNKNDVLEVNYLYGQKNRAKEFMSAQEIFWSLYISDETIRVRFNEICGIHARHRMDEDFIRKHKISPTLAVRRYNQICTRNFFWWESAYFFMWYLTAMTMKIPIYVGYPFSKDSENDSIFQIPLLMGKVLRNQYPDLFTYIDLVDMMPEEVEFSLLPASPYSKTRMLAKEQETGEAKPSKLLTSGNISSFCPEQSVFPPLLMQDCSMDFSVQRKQEPREEAKLGEPLASSMQREEEPERVQSKESMHSIFRQPLLMRYKQSPIPIKARQPMRRI